LQDTTKTLYVNGDDIKPTTRA